MKTITIDGRTYAAVEADENVACKDCIFHTAGRDLNTPQCAAVSIPGLRCDADNREDGKNVIFKLMANNVTEE